MKAILKFSFIILFLNSSIFAQAPQAFKYQAVARNSAGAILSNASVILRAGIRDITTMGTIVYQETHAVVTNSFGLININIGKGAVTAGTFTAVNWGIGDKFIEIEIDYGSGFISMGTSQLLSVPFALYAANGPVGPQGIQGVQGPIGVTGAQGIQGVPGPPGSNIAMPNIEYLNVVDTVSASTDLGLIIPNGTAANIYLPLISSVPKGKVIVLKRSGSSTLGNYLINGSGSDMIEYISGSAAVFNVTLSVGFVGVIRLVSDGISKWYIW